MLPQKLWLQHKVIVFPWRDGVREIILQRFPGLAGQLFALKGWRKSTLWLCTCIDVAGSKVIKSIPAWLLKRQTKGFEVSPRQGYRKNISGLAHKMQWLFLFGFVQKDKLYSLFLFSKVRDIRVILLVTWVFTSVCLPGNKGPLERKGSLEKDRETIRASKITTEAFRCWDEQHYKR